MRRGGGNQIPADEILADRIHKSSIELTQFFSLNRPARGGKYILPGEDCQRPQNFAVYELSTINYQL
jgi:hypothetical protein